MAHDRESSPAETSVLTTMLRRQRTFFFCFFRCLELSKWLMLTTIMTVIKATECGCGVGSRVPAEVRVRTPVSSVEPSLPTRSLDRLRRVSSVAGGRHVRSARRRRRRPDVAKSRRLHVRHRISTPFRRLHRRRRNYGRRKVTNRTTATHRSEVRTL